MIVRLTRTWLVAAIGALPLLAVLLVPQLLRSRVGPAEVVAVGIPLMLALVVGAVLFAPLASAIAAPRGAEWRRPTALATTRRVWRHRTGPAVVALALFLVGYLLSQVAGFALAEVMPYVTPAPSGGWTLHYGPYALQAGVIYALTTLGVAAYADRIRALADPA